MHKETAPLFLDPRAVIETCVTNETKLFLILAFKYVDYTYFGLSGDYIYFQKCVDNVAILSSANE